MIPSVFLYDESPALKLSLGLLFLLAACSALFVGVQLMFELREHELRQGIRMKC